jgi:dCTP deaminase
MILPAQHIRHRCIHDKLITPWHERTVQNGMSFGVSSAGYDIRIAHDLTLAGNTFSLAYSLERFRMPADLVATVHDKSTWARRGLAVQTTVIEPGWFGFLTLELTNHSPHTVILKEGDPVAQIMFHKLLEPTEAPYNGKYQNQPAEAVGARSE